MRGWEDYLYSGLVSRGYKAINAHATKRLDPRSALEGQYPEGEGRVTQTTAGRKNRGNAPAGADSRLCVGRCTISR